MADEIARLDGFLYLSQRDVEKLRSMEQYIAAAREAMKDTITVEHLGPMIFLKLNALLAADPFTYGQEREGKEKDDR